MILSDKNIRELINNQSLIIDPFDDSCVQPASIDCRLVTHFLKVNESMHSHITLDQEITYTEINNDSIVIPAHSFLLATTKETFKIPNGISAFVEGRSSIGRIGLFIQNAGWVDPGFEGSITLELYNANSLPIRLDADRRICQLVFCKMESLADRPYQGKYLGQQKSVGSRIFKDIDVHSSAPL